MREKSKNDTIYEHDCGDKSFVQLKNKYEPEEEKDEYEKEDLNADKLKFSK